MMTLSRLFPSRIDDDGESWEVIEDHSQFEDVVTFADGQCGENAAAFETTPSVGYVLALEPDGRDTEEEAVELAEVEQTGEFPAVDADIIEQQVRRDALQQEVVAVTGGRAPPGWRVDRFERAGGAVRLVATPPWSKRVPNMEPEDWVGSSKNGPKAPTWGLEDGRSGGLQCPRAAKSSLASSQS